jgi:hypothetical protein
MPASSRPEVRPGSTAPAWTADVTEAASAAGPVASSQLPLFPSGELAQAAPLARRTRLHAGIKALLTRRRCEPAATAPAASPPGSSWPDSFFGADAAREP